MRTIFSEKFDGVTAGVSVLPPNVTYTSTSADTYGTSTTFSLSSPNSFYATNASSALNTVIYSKTPDSTNGNLTVSGAIYSPAGTTDIRSGLYITVGPNLGKANASGNGYQLDCNQTDDIIFYRWNGASSTWINTLNGGGAHIGTGIWYVVTVTRSGPTFIFTIQRQSDGQWLSSTGWQADYCKVGTITDGSPLAQTASYGGILLSSNDTAQIAYGDNLIVRDFTTPLSSLTIPMRGVNLSWDTLDSLGTNDFDPWTQVITSGFNNSILQWQLQLADRAGCNCVRMGYVLDGVANAAYTLAQGQAALSQALVYCQSLNMYWFHREGAQVPAGNSTQAQIFSVGSSQRAAIAQTLIQYPCAVGFDLANEYKNPYGGGNSFYVAGVATLTMSDALWDTFFYQSIVAIRAVTQDLQLWASFTGNYAGSMGASIYQFDCMETHIYGAVPANADVDSYYASSGNYGAVGKPTIIGEFGGTPSSNPTRLAVMNGCWNNVVNYAKTGEPACIGMILWTCIPYNGQITTSTEALWIEQAGGGPPFTLASDIGSTFEGFAVTYPNFGGTSTTALSSTGQTHYGTTPNNVGAFSGTFAFGAISDTVGVISLTIQNTTDPKVRGSIVGLAFNTPSVASVTSLAITYNNTGLDLVNTTGTAFDCQNSVTGYGNATIGLCCLGRTWNCPGVIPQGPRAGIRNFQTGTVVIKVVGTGLSSVTVNDFTATNTSGAHTVWFAAHFRWLNDTDISTATTVGDDYVSSSSNI